MSFRDIVVFTKPLSSSGRLLTLYALCMYLGSVRVLSRGHGKHPFLMSSKSPSPRIEVFRHRQSRFQDSNTYWSRGSCRCEVRSPTTWLDLWSWNFQLLGNEGTSSKKVFSSYHSHFTHTSSIGRFQVSPWWNLDLELLELILASYLAEFEHSWLSQSSSDCIFTQILHPELLMVWPLSSDISSCTRKNWSEWIKSERQSSGVVWRWFPRSDHIQMCLKISQN